MHSFELRVGYTWWTICHAVYKDNLLVQVDLCCRLFKYSLMHTHGGIIGARIIGARVLTQNVPVSIFQAKSFAFTRRAKHD